MDTIVRSDLIDKITGEFRVTREQAAGYVATIMHIISDSLMCGCEVRINNFGTFHLRNKKGRVGRNPKTMEEYPIHARRSVSFVASDYLKKVINRN